MNKTLKYENYMFEYLGGRIWQAWKKNDKNVYKMLVSFLCFADADIDELIIRTEKVINN